MRELERAVVLLRALDLLLRLPVQAALQRPVGANSIELTGAGLIPDVRALLADLKT